MNMTEVTVGIVCAFCAAFITYIATMESVHNDCTALGKFRIGEAVYECRKMEES